MLRFCGNCAFATSSSKKPVHVVLILTTTSSTAPSSTPTTRLARRGSPSARRMATWSAHQRRHRLRRRPARRPDRGLRGRRAGIRLRAHPRRSVDLQRLPYVRRQRRNPRAALRDRGRFHPVQPWRRIGAVRRFRSPRSAPAHRTARRVPRPTRPGAMWPRRARVGWGSLRRRRTGLCSSIRSATSGTRSRSG